MERKPEEKRKRACHGKKKSNDIEQLPNVLIEEILERIGAESLIRFTSVSKQWNSMIKSTSFASRHLIRAQSRNPSILLAGARAWNEPYPFCYLKKVELGSSELKEAHIMPNPYECCVITGSCDGLVCVYGIERLMCIINPATRWFRSFPRPKIQKINRLRRILDGSYRASSYPGFGKDTMTGKYKIVWLYNSSELGLDGHTTCEVFDFSTNSWRNVTGSTHRICEFPVYLDGSLHWLTLELNGGKTKIIRFDLHTEVFEVVVEIRTAHPSPCWPNMHSLNNRLCVVEQKTNCEEIWSLNSHKVWEKTYSINLSNTSPWFGNSLGLIRPVTVFNKTELLFRYRYINYPCLLVQDTRTGSCSLYSKATQLDQVISYIPSLISI